MKVLHISSTDSGGGAARGAYSLHKALRASGVDSRMLVGVKHTDDFTVIEPRTKLEKAVNHFRPHIDVLPLSLYPGRRPYAFSPAWVPNVLGGQVKRLTPDIINLQWVCGGFLRPESLRRFRRPLVWTLRDMWAFTGGCHYSLECERYIERCGACPMLGSSKEHDLSRRLWQRKMKAWGNLNLTVVTISSWLAGCAQASSLFKDKRVEVIHNALDERVYKPMEKKVVREMLGFPQNKKLILFGAINPVGDEIKGFKHLKAALEVLASSGKCKDAELVVFGSSEPECPPDLGLKARYLGRFHDDLSLAMIYAASDVMVVPSEREAFGKTAMESLACGTPVVCFDTSGLKDIVEHKENGFRAKCFDPVGLAHGIMWVLKDDKRRETLSRRAREKVTEEFTLKAQVRKYVALYEDVLKGGA